jgi:hypothetical protein
MNKTDTLWDEQKIDTLILPCTCQQDIYVNGVSYVGVISCAIVFLQLFLPKYSQTIACIKRSHFSYPVIEQFIWIEPLLRVHLFWNTSFALSQRRPLNTGLTVPIYKFILQSVHLLYKYAMRINFCFIRTIRINFSAYEINFPGTL